MPADTLDWAGYRITHRDSVAGFSSIPALRLTANSIVVKHSGPSPEEIAAMFDVPVDSVREIMAYTQKMRASLYGH